jgi:16S rRNA (cytidine1402-2'-O)-methyltransferase
MIDTKIRQLFIVTTPIGNLADITLRALEVLKSVDFVLCEDTRVTKKLLDHYQINTPTISYHQHSDEKKVKEIKELLKQGKNLALVTDAGTPGISDPGNLLIADLVGCHSELVSGSIDIKTHANGEILNQVQDDILGIIPIPGVSAATAALSISGFPTDKFIFMGFPPHKNKRQKFFKEVAENKYTTAFYESNHRIKKCLDNLKEVLQPNRQIVVCRELTKKFETIYRGTIEEILKMDIKEKGEFVVIVKN